MTDLRARKARARQATRRDEIIRLLKGLRDCIEDSSFGVKYSDLQELEQKMDHQKSFIDQHEQRIDFIEKGDLQKIHKLEGEVQSLKLTFNQLRPEIKTSFWNRILGRKRRYV